MWPAGCMLPTPGIDFNNILRSAIMHTNPKSAEKTDGLTVFFLRFWIIKAARKILMKLTTGL